eukprot:3583019-Prymnesium_polylepis.1
MACPSLIWHTPSLIWHAPSLIWHRRRDRPFTCAHRRHEAQRAPQPSCTRTLPTAALAPSRPPHLQPPSRCDRNSPAERRARRALRRLSRRALRRLSRRALRRLSRRALRRRCGGTDQEAQARDWLHRLHAVGLLRCARHVLGVALRGGGRAAQQEVADARRFGG